MDFKEMETFVVIVEKGSLSAAAASLGLSQPAVSKRVARLESEMGASLFVPGHRHSTLTVEGELFYKTALKMLDLRRKTSLQIAERSQEVTGEVTIGASSIPGDFILPELLVEFSKFYGGVTVRVETTDSQTALKALSDREVDLAVIGSERCLPGYNSKPLFDDELVLAVPQGHRLASSGGVALDDLAGIRLVGRCSGSGTRQTWERQYKSRQGACHDLALQFGHAMGVVSAVAHGAEGGIVSRFAVQANSKVAAVPFVPSLRRSFHLVYGTCNNRAVDLLLSFLLERAEGRD